MAAGVLAALATLAAAEPVTVERDSVARAEPRTDSAVVANIAGGSAGEALARQGAWVQVKTATATGWLYSFNVRFGAAAGSAGGAGGGSVLGRVFAPRQKVNVTATIGIRGLDEADLKQAQFDGSQLQALDGFAASREQAEAHAGDAGLNAARVDYLAQPAAAAGSDAGGAP
ncbi:MAG: hypothetical protein KF834_11360 [Burkholderiales bacterium]|nr:hypothetical protein [Burkholderiales bacterium]